MHAYFSRRFTNFKSFPTTTFSKKFSSNPNNIMNATTTPRPPGYYKFLQHLRNDRIEEARWVFNYISFPTDIHLYTMMITGYTQNNNIGEALSLFNQIPNTLKDVVSWNSMMKGCLDCGKLEIALQLFDEMPQRNVVSWTTVVNGFAQFGNIEMAEKLFCEMPWGWRDTAAWNSMLFGYCSNGRIQDARKFFEEMPKRNVISWTTMISGLEMSGRNDEALSLFREMRGLGSVEATSSTLSCVLTACAKISDLYRGVQIHAHVIKIGYYAFNIFVSASLITFYANCRQMESSQKVFREIFHTKDVVIWTALVTGYGLNGEHEKALDVFHAMMNFGTVPNQSTFTSALNSCCELDASLDGGKMLHAETIKLGLDLDVFVGNSLIVMYSKCGEIDDGVTVFNNMSKRNLVSWNSVIVGCAQHGCGTVALDLFDEMVASCDTDGVQPDEITFVGLLTACSRSNMLEKAKYFFELLNQDPSVEMKLEHCTCMVDVLGRSGNLEEAEEFIMKMPMKANSTIWLALLSACRVHSNLQIATRAAEAVWELEPHSSAAYVLLSNIYASAGQWNDVSRVRGMMEERGAGKKPGSSWLTLKGSKHEFLCGDPSHPMSNKIYQKLAVMGEILKEFGYVPDQRFALHDVEDEQKDVLLSYHSEKLAIGFGLITSAEGSTIRVMKNLRVCGDCHSYIKLMSKIVGRKIIVRDSSRFHHFRDGNCSCGDYW